VNQLDSDHFELDREIADLESVLRETIVSMKSRIGDRKIEFSSGASLPPILLDRKLIKLALKQLLDNALKYSPAGSPVLINSFCSGETAGLEITDHGKGIPDVERGRIFQRFYRSAETRDQIPGYGLGLSIAYRILRAHGGDLTVKSHPGETTFRLSLPLNNQNVEENKA
jgi:signal transduction histidine kinase